VAEGDGVDVGSTGGGVDDAVAEGWGVAVAVETVVAVDVGAAVDGVNDVGPGVCTVVEQAVVTNASSSVRPVMVEAARDELRDIALSSRLWPS
jgi:hypothetical protein